MRVTILGIAAALLLIVDGALAAGWELGTYGHPGSVNGGIYVTRADTCKGWGVELWGHPGPFAQLDC